MIIPGWMAAMAVVLIVVGLIWGPVWLRDRGFRRGGEFESPNTFRPYPGTFYEPPDVSVHDSYKELAMTNQGGVAVYDDPDRVIRPKASERMARKPRPFEKHFRNQD